MNNFFKMFKDDSTTLLRFNVQRHGTGVVLELRRFSRVKCVDLKHGKAQADGMVFANQGAAVPAPLQRIYATFWGRRWRLGRDFWPVLAVGIGAAALERREARRG